VIVGTSFRTNKKIAAVVVMAVVVAEELTSVVFGGKEQNVDCEGTECGL
jgi:hypothetical protein